MRRDVVKALLTSFVGDRDSPNPLGNLGVYTGTKVEDISKVSVADLSKAFIIVDPWEFVGVHPETTQPVYATENLAYLINQITGAETFIISAWENGVGDPLVFAATARASLGVILQGGVPDVHEEDTFNPKYKRSMAISLIIEMMLNGSPFLGISLAHQLAAQAHIDLIKLACRRLVDTRKASFVNVGRRVEELGTKLSVLKGYGTVALGWNDRRFAVAPNEESSIHVMQLFPYEHCEQNHIPSEITEAHRYVSQLYNATIDTALHYNTIHVQTFHTNEVSQEATRFICWAYQLIHRLTVAYKDEIAKEPSLNFLLSMPVGIEATSSTRHPESQETLCEVASTAIYWLDRSAQTTQFHPELDESLLTISSGWMPSWKEIKGSESIQLFAQLLLELVR